MSAEQRAVLAVLLVPTFVSLLAVSSVNVLLTVLQASLAAPDAGLQWVVAGYSLVFGVVLVPAGRAGDVLGRGRLFVTGLLLFGLGSLASGLAASIEALNVARVVMGVGAGLLNPQVTGMIQRFFPASMRGRAFGWFGGVVGVSVALGPLMSGVLIELLGPDVGWRASFVVNTPIALVGVVAAVRFLPAAAWRGAAQDPPAQDPAEQERRRAETRPQARPALGEVAPAAGMRRRRVDLDPVGTVLLAAAVLLLMLPFVGLGPGRAGVLAGGTGLLLLVSWVAWERRYLARGREPVVDLRLLTLPSFSTGWLVITVYFFGCTSVWIVLAQYVQAGLGLSPLTTGIIGLPSSLAAALLSPVVGRFVVRAGRPMVLGGVALTVVGLLLAAAAVTAGLDTARGTWVLAATLLLVGAGQALVVSPNQALSLMDVPVSQAGAAGGVLQTGQRLGTATGVAVISSVAFAVAGRHGWARALEASFGLIVAVLLVAGALAVADLLRVRREAAPHRP